MDFFIFWLQMIGLYFAGLIGGGFAIIYWTKCYHDEKLKIYKREKYGNFWCACRCEAEPEANLDIKI